MGLRRRREKWTRLDAGVGGGLGAGDQSIPLGGAASALDVGVADVDFGPASRRQPSRSRRLGAWPVGGPRAMERPQIATNPGPFEALSVLGQTGSPSSAYGG